MVSHALVLDIQKFLMNSMLANVNFNIRFWQKECKELPVLVVLNVNNSLLSHVFFAHYLWIISSQTELDVATHSGFMTIWRRYNWHNYMVGGVVGGYKNAFHFDAQEVLLDTLLVERLILFHLYQCKLLDISNRLKEKPIYNLVIHHIRLILFIMPYFLVRCLLDGPWRILQ